MKKILVLILSITLLQSCIISTAAKAVKGVATVGYKAVKGTVKGVSWAVGKAKGKIDEDRIDGTWKVVGVYRGSFADFEKDPNPESSFTTSCTAGFDQMVFHTKRSRFKPVHCSNTDEKWIKYDFKFGKNPATNERENYIEYSKNNYISVIDVNSKTMVLEGNLMPELSFSTNTVYLLEQVK